MDRTANNAPGQSGFGLPEVLIAIVILSVVSVGITRLFSSSLKLQLRSNTTSSLDSLKRDFISYVNNDSAWQYTVADAVNANMACLKNSLACTHNGNSTTGSPAGIPLSSQPFRLRDAANGIVYDAVTDPTAGYTMNGSPCTGFSSSGNDSCPIQYTLTWSAICTGSCINPQIRVSARLDFQPSSASRNLALNRDNYSAEFIRGVASPVGGSVGTAGRVVVTAAQSPYTFQAPAGVSQVFLTMCGGGGGGAGDGPAIAGAKGGDSFFGTLRIARGGFGGQPTPCCWGPGPGGAPGGAGGSHGSNGYTGTFPHGGNSVFGVGGVDFTGSGSGTGRSGSGYGAGGAGGSDGINQYGGSGGGAECILSEAVPVSGGASYTVTIGAGGSGGSAGLVSGGAGSAGFALIEWY